MPRIAKFLFSSSVTVVKDLAPTNRVSIDTNTVAQKTLPFNVG